MNDAVCSKIKKNLRDRIDAKLESNGKDYLKQALKPSFISRKIFDDDLVAIIYIL